MIKMKGTTYALEAGLDGSRLTVTVCPAHGQGAGFNMPLAIIGLVCLEARVKFKNIDFRTEASPVTVPFLHAFVVSRAKVGSRRRHTDSAGR